MKTKQPILLLSGTITALFCVGVLCYVSAGIALVVELVARLVKSETPSLYLPMISSVAFVLGMLFFAQAQQLLLLRKIEENTRRDCDHVDPANDSPSGV